MVLEFSARNVGPKVYALPSEQAKVSASNCPLTVRNAGRWKKSCEKSTFHSGLPWPSTGGGGLLSGSVVTWNISPAPSQSLAVMIGVWT